MSTEVSEGLRLQDAVPIIFSREAKKKVFFFSVQEGITNARDLFLLCVRLLLGGLIHVFRSDAEMTKETDDHECTNGGAEEERRADAFLEALTAEQVRFVRERLALAGIHANVDTMPLTEVKKDLLNDTTKSDDDDGWAFLETTLRDSGIHQFRHVIMNGGDGGELEDHALIIGTPHSRIVISFVPVLNEVVDE